MIEKEIKHIAYQLQRNKKEGNPGAIVFIGAGCSVSAGIPTVDKIIEYVLEEYKDHPDIEKLDRKSSYVDLMECLGPLERNKIFKNYVDKAKINVSHIYLAHLMITEYVDYIVTVNFDNLAQRALALYNNFPPIYDISILKDLTTTTLDTKSITYLHGQYQGLWQLNTKDEMNKVRENEIAKSIFEKISNNRLWIIVGYSGEDFIFNQLIKLGRFNNGIYWIGFRDYPPSEHVQSELLNKPNTESFLVKGYDADSFFLKLNAELKNDHPKIFDSPFSFLANLQNSIIDIDDSDEYKFVKERFIGSKNLVQDAIHRYEKSESDRLQMSNEDIERSQLSMKLINCLINGKYEELAELEIQAKNKSYKDTLPIISDIYFNWGTDLGNLADIKFGVEAEEFYLQAFNKFRKAIETKPDQFDAYQCLGFGLGKLAELKSGIEADELYLQAFENYGKAIEIKPDLYEVYSRWGTDLAKYAAKKTGSEAKSLNLMAFEKLIKASELGGGSYNLACLFAITSQHNEALYWLGICLNNKEVLFEQIENDNDWDELRTNPQYEILKQQFSK